MDIASTLLSEHSKRVTELIVRWVDKDEQRLGELVHLVVSNQTLLSQRAAWPLSYVVGKNPHLIHPHLPALLGLLDQPKVHDAVIRNIFKLLEHVEIPENMEAQAVDAAIRFIKNPGTAIAIKAFAITFLGNICRKYPDLINEIRLLTEEQGLTDSPAIRVRIRRLLKILDQIHSNQ